jgi:hypothetical protein
MLDRVRNLQIVVAAQPEKDQEIRSQTKTGWRGGKAGGAIC